MLINTFGNNFMFSKVCYISSLGSSILIHLFIKLLNSLSHCPIYNLKLLFIHLSYLHFGKRICNLLNNEHYYNIVLQHDILNFRLFHIFIVY